jgi:hypothetical protein
MFDKMRIFINQAMLDFKVPEVEVVLALDPYEKSWRHEAYPLYKGNRPEAIVNKAFIKQNMVSLCDALGNHLRFIPCGAENAEADDVIATLTKDAQAQDITTIIYSTDADFIQLLSDNVHQYRPLGNAYYVTLPGELKIAHASVWCESPEHFLQLSVLTGQAGKDGIYHIKCPDEIPEGKRRPPFGVKAAQKVIDAAADIGEYVLEKFGEECLCRYERNDRLINFKNVPEAIKASVLETFLSAKDCRPGKCTLCAFVKEFAPYSEMDRDDIQDLGGLYNTCII